MPLTSSSSLGSFGTLDQRVAGGDLLAVGHLEVSPSGHQGGVLGPVVGDHRDAPARLVVLHPDHARVVGQHGRTLGRAGLEELDDTGQAVGDVLTDHTTGVEGPHGQLRAGLADGLGRDDTDGLAQLDHRPGGQRQPVAGGADALGRLTGQHRADPDAVDRRVVAHGGDRQVVEQRADRVRRPVRERHVLGQEPAEGAGLEVVPVPRTVGLDALDPDATGRPAVVDADDELLGHVDQTPGQVPRVGRAQRGVGQSLAGAVGGDEVLQDREALTEGGLDRPGDHLTARVGHQALHAGDLADLLRVPSGTRVHHHVERVEGDRGQLGLHGPPDLGVGRGPDLDLLLAPLVVGDDAPLELRLRLLGLLLVAVEDGLLVRRRLHVVDGDGQTRLGGEAEAQRLDPVQARGHHVLGVVGRQLLDDQADGRVALADHVVDVGEALGQRLVEEHPARRGVEHEHAVLVGDDAGRRQTPGQGRPGGRPQRDRHLQVHVTRVEGGLDLVEVTEHPPRTRARPRPAASGSRRRRPCPGWAR